MFIGREKELRVLDSKIATNRFEFGIIYGRRRIGKTRLLQEVVKRHGAIYYVANEMGLEYNLKQLSHTIASYFNEPFTFDSFEKLFEYLSKKSQEQTLILILDEFTYLMSNQIEILSMLQNIIDHQLLNSRLKLILSGSHVGMIEDSLSYNKPLYGRSTFKLKIEPFDYYDASKFYPNFSNEDKVRMYSIFGGVPFYISKIDDSLNVKDNILSLIIDEGAIFEDEIVFFLSQEVKSIATYGKIIHAIANGATKLHEIASKSGAEHTGNISKHLDILISLGIIEKEYCFGEKIGSKKTIYKIKDQLFNFHYRFIEKNKTQKVIMSSENFYKTYVEQYLDEFVAFGFEIVCKDFLKRKYRDSLEEIGRYWMNDAKLKKDIEIDILMRKAGELFAFECKWSKKPIGHTIENELLNKTSHLKLESIGLFSRSGYEKIKSTTLAFNIDDLYKL
jgi:uncharacterized protein